MIEFNLKFSNTNTGVGGVKCTGSGKALKTEISGNLYPAQLDIVNQIVQLLKKDQAINRPEPREPDDD